MQMWALAVSAAAVATGAVAASAAAATTGAVAAVDAATDADGEAVVGTTWRRPRRSLQGLTHLTL